MKRWLVTLSLACLFSLVHAAVTSNYPLQKIRIDVRDHAKLQRGARLFMNYCSGCHALRYVRYSRMAMDLGLVTFDGEIDKELLFNNLVFTESKLHDPIHIAMPPVDSRQWFGIEPPDLSLSARAHGANWIYTYLKSFYADSTRPFGTNNLLVPDVAMPNILQPLAGWVIAVDGANQPTTQDISHLLLINQGEMNQNEFDSAVQDLVTFLVYVAEPAQLVRYRIGVGVLIFLSLFLIVAYQLKNAYWRRLHGPA